MAAGTVGILVAGVGRMGAFHAHTLAGRVPGARVAAVVDADGARAAEVGAELGVTAFAGMEEALDRSGAEAVVVATPSATHATWVEAAAQRGMAIFCEKPLGTDLASAAHALEVAHTRGVILQLGYQRRFDRGFEALRDEVAAGRLGRVVMVKSSSRDPELSPLSYLKGAGGIFQDQMIHDIDILRYLSGHEIVEAYGAGGAFFQPELEALGDVDTAALVVRFDDGGLGVADASRRSGYGHDIGAEVFGTLGSARLDSARERPITVFGSAGASWRLPYWFLERFGEAYERELLAFVAVVRGQGAPRVSGRDGLLDMLVADAATRSLQSGRPERVASMATFVGL
jgi:myo-inositol 2-dehydrogenase/D-chiro-inositol 1-dehydrogenase